MRLIDKDAVLKLCSKSGEGVVSYEEVEEKLPEIDAVPVVRCKDCKYYDRDNCCMNNGLIVRDDGGWFCADGERRGGND